MQTQYRPTVKQTELHKDPTRFKVIVFGRRSGKSTYAFNEALATCLERPNQKVWIVTPTFQQARDIYWKGGDISQYLWPEMYNKKNDSTLTIEFKNESVLQLKSAERPETLRGSGIDLIIVDEAATIRYLKTLWEEVLLPALSDKMGRAIFIGTPKGFNYFYDLYLMGENKEDSWKSWKIPTADSTNYWTLTEEGKKELERLKNTMSEDSYAQEYGADFRKHTGLVYKDWDRLIHVRDFEIKTSFPIECGMDFGYTHPTVVVFSYFDNDDNWYIFDEYAQEEKTIFVHSGTIRSIREKYPNPLKAIYGDSEDAQSISEYANHGWFITPVVKKPDSVIIGIDRISERLKVNPVTRQPKMFVHPRCVKFIDEIERYRWDEGRYGEGIQDKVEKTNDDCFVGDTIVVTKKGNMKIKDVKKGEKVLTSKGFQKVLLKHNIGKRLVKDYLLQFDIGSVIIKCTPEHKIKTTTGWTQISKLQSGQMVYLHRDSMEGFTAYIQEEDISQATNGRYIGPYGSSQTERSLKGLISTTKITTHGIMSFLTSNLEKFLGIFRNILKRGSEITPNGLQDSKLGALKAQKSGINPQRETNGTGNMEGSVGLEGHIENSPANNAGKNTRQDPLGNNPNIVIKTVKCVQELPDSERQEKVYDLTVDLVHEYFVNGLLVHNCMDASRYIILMHNKNQKNYKNYEPIRMYNPAGYSSKPKDKWDKYFTF